MKVVYTAPNRGHHYRYALALANEGLLHKFVSGFSRFSPRAAFPEIGDKLVRADRLQNLYLASLRFRLDVSISKKLAYLAKKEQDLVCKRFLKETDIFLFYSGSGLNTCKAAKRTDTILIAEAVNSHVAFQEDLLKTEFESLKIPWSPFYRIEMDRRIQEYELADYILLPSGFVEDSFLKYGFSRKKLLKIPYGFNQLNISSFNTIDTKVISNEFIILYVGSISVRKGLRYLIQAFEQLRHPQKRLTIVGPLSTPSGIEDLKMPDGVIFTGELKGEELESCYRNANVFCLPSVEEGLALVLGEALSFGIPIIATENTGANDIIENGEEGYIVPPRDSKAIAEKLQILADDNAEYGKMKEKALNKSLNLNGWSETGKMLTSCLKSVFNNR